MRRPSRVERSARWEGCQEGLGGKDNDGARARADGRRKDHTAERADEMRVADPLAACIVISWLISPLVSAPVHCCD